ncbi:MAG: YgiT-type zinc finger protein [Bryobacteraceae bacterium]
MWHEKGAASHKPGISSVPPDTQPFVPLARVGAGGLLESRVTDLPFKVGDSSIVILRSLPVLECRQCGDTELEQATMPRVDQLLAAVDGSAELEVIRCAA